MAKLNDTLTLQIEGHVNDQTTDNLEGWDDVIDGNVPPTGSSATITTVFSTSAAYYKIKTQWTYCLLKPFTATGRSITVSWRHNGTVPTTGAISLNQIHQEAGGSSGTSVTINDSDVRGKSWFARIRGSNQFWINSRLRRLLLSATVRSRSERNNLSSAI